MEERDGTASALAVMGAALDGIDHAARRELGAAARLRLVEAARVVQTRVGALVGVLVAEADAAGASLVARGTPTTGWLALSGRTSSKEAAGLVFAGRDVASSDAVRDAALAGEVEMAQARGIVKALESLPTQLTEPQRRDAERLLIERAQSSDAGALARSGPEVLAEVAPELVPCREDELARLDAQRKRAHARRGLSLVSDGDGSVLVRGSLPCEAAAPLVRLIDAYVESDRRAGRDRAGERVDPLVERRSPEQRRADGLLALVAAHQAVGVAPRVAGDRPRVVVTIRESDLRQRAEQAGLLADGEPISAGDLRRLSCDADLTPVVLGSASEVLDVGRTVRLVTSALRRALSVRDGGCVFPGCGAGDVQCDAHHIEPWWAGGVTAIQNLVLLCPHHHGLVEPLRFWSGSPPDRWEIRLDDRGLPEVIPPARVDRSRIPIPGRRPQAAEAG